MMTSATTGTTAATSTATATTLPTNVFRTVAGKLVGMLVAFLVAALLVIGLTLLQSWKLEGGAAAINDMGSERMRTYRIAYLTAEYARGVHREATRQALAEAATAFESMLARVRQGDPARPLFLPSGDAIAQQVATIDQHWRERFRPMVDAVLSEAGPPAVELSRAEVEAFVGLIDRLVGDLEKENADATTLLRTLQMALMALAVIGTVGLSYLVFIVVIKPVNVLCEGIRCLQSEDFSTRIPEEGDDEFGTLARAFNSMAAHLQRVYATLEARVQDKTRRFEERNRELTTLYEVTSGLHEAGGAEALCRTFLASIRAAFGASAAAVRLRRSEHAGLHPFVTDGIPEEAAFSEACANAALCQCGPGPDEAQAVLRPLRTGDRPCPQTPFAAVATVPIRFNRRVTGVFNLYFAEPTVLEERTQRMLEVLGHHLGTALENDRLQSAEKELAVSEERSLIARELHDSIAQSLAFLNLQTQMLEGSLARGDPAAASDEVNQIRAGVQECYDDVRELLVHFRARVQDADLSAALRQTVSRFEGQTGIETRLEELGQGVDLPAEDQVQVLHVIQEALSNVRKHAHARHVVVQVERGAVCRFRVRDDGIGFDLQVPDSTGTHVGLQIMRERAHRVGATLEVRSAPGSGTEVSFVLPAAGRRAA